MSEVKALSERIDALEAKAMFQDETIEALNKTITEQWLKIDALTRQLERDGFKFGHIRRWRNNWRIRPVRR